MPLANDVILEALAEHELTGGEIKNAIINAARSALCREDKLIRMGDFEEAIRMEIESSWDNGANNKIGFGRI